MLVNYYYFDFVVNKDCSYY